MKKHNVIYGLLLAAVSLPALALTSPTQPTFSKNEKQALSLSQKWMGKESKAITDGSGRVTYFFGSTLPTVVCTPFKTCVLELNKGEVINQEGGLQIGDTTRWRINPTISGTGANARTQLVIKPTDSDLETTLTVATNQRIYQVKLISDKKQWMPLVNFDYPEERAAQWQKYQAQVSTKTQRNTLPDGQSVPDLDFNYKVTGKADFKPLRVYNDGNKTIVEMSSRVEHRVLPTLLVVNGDQQELVNYRYKKSYLKDGRRINGRFVVDQLSSSLMLVVGIGSHQKSVLITYEGD